MLISFKEQVIDNFLIPSFSLSQGEIVIIQAPGGPFFQPVSMKIIDGVTGKTPNVDIEIITPSRYAEHIKANLFRHLFFPLTVGRYIRRYSNKHNPVAEKIFAIKWITPSTKIDTLPGTVRRKLSIYAALSWTNNIVFDLSGVDPQGGVEIYSYIKTMVQQGGAAVLVDCSDEFKTDCTTFVEAKYIAAH